MTRALGVTTAFLGLAACGREPPPPHVVLVTIDTLRADHLSLYGYARATSPEIDAFGAEALVFTDAITLLPKTAPGMATHLSGLPPCAHGVRSNPVRIPAGVPMLAERLRERGYRTAAFVANPVLAAAKGFGRGFDHFEVIEAGDPTSGESFVRGGTVELNARFLEWASDGDWERPTFVWLHYLDPHGPYNPPAEVEALFLRDALGRADRRKLPTDYEPLPGKPVNWVLGAIPRYQARGGEQRVGRYIARYDAEIRHVDAAFADVIGFLRGRNLFDGAAVLLTSDHGESLGENDYWFEHGWFVGEGSLRIPMIVKPPGGADGLRVDRTVSNLDTTPTILALAGVEQPAELEGRDLLGPLPKTGPFLIENMRTYPDRFVGVRTSHYKFLREVYSGREELHDLRAGPGDVSGELPELAARLRRELDGALAACAARSHGQAEEIRAGEELSRQLEALGYTDH